MDTKREQLYRRLECAVEVAYRLHKDTYDLWTRVDDPALQIILDARNAAYRAEEAARQALKVHLEEES